MIEVSTDKSRLERDWSCQRQTYWHDVVEIEAAVMYPTPAFGIAVDDAISRQIAAAEGVEYAARDEDLLLSAVELDFADRLAMGFMLRVWPEWMKEWRFLGLQRRYEALYEGRRWTTRPDLIVAHRGSGQPLYVDLKVKESWPWDIERRLLYDAQFQLAFWILERAGVEQAIGSVQGIVRGTVRDGRLIHPFASGYRHEGRAGITTTAYRYRYRSGFERFDPVQQYPGGLEAWILNAPDQLIKELYPRTAWIQPNQGMQDAIIAQRLARAKAIDRARVVMAAGYPLEDASLALDFPQSLTSCPRCDYEAACWMAAVRDDPVGSGMYRRREARPTNDPAP